MVENYFANNVVKFSFAPESDHHNNYKFAVLVPHTFIDKTGSTTETYETYSYSFTQNSTDVLVFFMLSVAGNRGITAVR